jgi:polyhydroxyalkanoate synthesis repressor PhaR
MAEPVLVKRYANRKLYNTETSRYITLRGIQELIEDGREVRVLDNESGEDITSVALSQILVDSERTSSHVPGSVLSELIQKGGDALYSALRSRVGDAQEGMEELRRSVRRDIGQSEREVSEFISESRENAENVIQRAVERVFERLDMPRRSDLAELNDKLDRVAKAIENLVSDERKRRDS